MVRADDLWSMTIGGKQDRDVSRPVLTSGHTRDSLNVIPVVKIIYKAGPGRVSKLYSLSLSPSSFPPSPKLCCLFPSLFAVSLSNSELCQLVIDRTVLHYTRLCVSRKGRVNTTGRVKHAESASGGCSVGHPSIHRCDSSSPPVSVVILHPTSHGSTFVRNETCEVSDGREWDSFVDTVILVRIG
jgi:hypothetical protein